MAFLSILQQLKKRIRKKKGKGMDGAGDGKRGKHYILLIDGHDKDRAKTGLLLQKFGYSVYSAPTVAAALDFFCAAHPVGVIADAGLEGLNLLELVKKDPRFSDVPIVLLRSSPGQGSPGAVRAAAWIEKPVAVEALYRIVQAAIEKTSRKNIRISTHLNAKVGAGEVAGSVTTLSEFGLFFQVRDVLPKDTVVPVSIELEGRTIKASAVVLYVSKYEEGSSREPGMGMKFTTISPGDRALVKAFVLKQFG